MFQGGTNSHVDFRRVCLDLAAVMLAWEQRRQAEEPPARGGAQPKQEQQATGAAVEGGRCSPLMFTWVCHAPFHPLHAFVKSEVLMQVLICMLYAYLSLQLEASVLVRMVMIKGQPR
jgi:hypothetical protein